MKRNIFIPAIGCCAILLSVASCDLASGDKSSDKSASSQQQTDGNVSQSNTDIEEVASVYAGRWLSDSKKSTIGYKKALITRPEVNFDNDGKGTMGFAFTMSTDIDDATSYTVRGSVLAQTQWEERGDTLFIYPDNTTFKVSFDQQNPLTIKTRNESERDALLADRDNILNMSGSLIKSSLIEQMPSEVRWTHIELNDDKMSVINLSGIKITYKKQVK